MRRERADWLIPDEQGLISTPAGRRRHGQLNGHLAKHRASARCLRERITVPSVYLLFLDEAGTHGSSPAFVVAGIAVPEEDTWFLQQKVESFLHRRLTPLGLNALDFEIHANPMMTGAKEWSAISDYADRMQVLHGAYLTLLNYASRDTRLPVVCFGAVVDQTKQPNRSEREKWAYELILKKFDDMLRRTNRSTSMPQRGLVIHDQRIVNVGGRVRSTAEQQILSWTRAWRDAAGRLGPLKHFADVPLFADSKATRLLQMADLTAWAVWRQYSQRDDRWLRLLWPMVDGAHGAHGVIHMSNAFANGTCPCPACRLRLGLSPYP